jgi:hypothetical protein
MLPGLRTTSRKKRRRSNGNEPETDYTTRNSGTNLAGSLKTDPVWNLSLRENAMGIVLNAN